ncbi:MAG: radical SAM protein, partial [Desulfobulbia bacterium]
MTTTSPNILLVNPPVAKPSEPPAGIARLAGGLRENGIASEVLDLNLHCLLAEFDHDVEAQDRWSRRASKNRQYNLAQIKSPELYHSFDRYQRVVSDLGRVLSLA